MKDCIRDFVESWRPYDGPRSLTIPVWSTRFQDAGYFSVPLTDNNLIHNWPNVHKWCEHEFGKRHYTWTGKSFFEFKHECDFLLFILRWS